MYTISEDDDLIQLTQIPPPDTLQPFPTLFVDDDRLFLAYYLNQTADGSQEPVIQLVSNTTTAPCVILLFTYARLHTFGLPNDEALDAHPLSGRGLKPHGAFEVKNSSWVYQLETTKRGYQHHDPERFGALRHFIFTFHDKTFECLAEDYRLSLEKESIANIMQRITGGK